MATDLEQLVVQLSSDFKSYENAMAKASGITRKQLAQIRADAAAVGGAAGPAFDRAAAGAAKFGAVAVRAKTQVAQLQGQTGNLAAQFNDIGVQLAGGQSPFLIALQQGTQISQVLGGQGARGAVAALAGAFGSLLNPVGLATIAFITLGGAAIQYFSGLLGDSEKSAEELKKQAELISRVADQWGDAIPAVRAYADELKRASEAREVLEAAEAVQIEIESDVRADFDALTDQFDDLLVLLPDVNREIGVLDSKIQAGSVTAKDFEQTQAALAAVMEQHSSPALVELAAALAAMSAQAGAAAEQIAEVGNQAAVAAGKVRDFASAQAMRDSTRQVQARGADFIAEQERLNSLTADQLALEQEVSRVREEARRNDVVISEADAARLASETLAAEKARAEAARAAARSSSTGGGGSSGGVDKAVAEAEREREAVVKLIEALQFEQSLVGATDLERETANALRRAGAAATAEQRAQIEQLVAATYAEVEAIEASEAAMENLKAISQDVLQGMVDDLIKGKDAADIFANAITRAGAALAQSGVDALIEGAFGGGLRAVFGGGGAGRGIVGAGAAAAGVYHKGGVAGQPSEMRLVSPSIFAGARRYHGGGVVGLDPGEVPAILQRGERVIPRGGSLGGGQVDVRVHVDQDGNWQAAVERISGAQVRAAEPRVVGRSVAAMREGSRRTRHFSGDR